MIDFTYELTIPAGTLQSDPEALDVTLSEGLLKRVIITWQEGPRYLAYTTLWYGGQQFAPAVKGQGYNYDGYNLTIEPNFDLTQKEHIITIKGWSPEAIYSHKLYYTFSIDKPADSSIIDALQSLFR